jgi:hypothetical protein
LEVARGRGVWREGARKREKARESEKRERKRERKREKVKEREREREREREEERGGGETCVAARTRSCTSAPYSAHLISCHSAYLRRIARRVTNG